MRISRTCSRTIGVCGGWRGAGVPERATSPPLEGVRVLAVEQFGAGPWATLQLADLGAEVIKIEDPASGGDVGRYVPPYQEDEDSLFFETFNRGKLSVSLDLRAEAGRRVLHDLVARSDVVFCNLRGDLPAKLGLDYAALAHLNRRVVCCSLSAFGATGPRAAEGGYDYLVQGLAGWMSLTGEASGPPAKSGLSLVDLSTGYAATVAILAGLRRADREGVGCDCDVSLFETALHQLAYVGTWAATERYVPERLDDSAHPSIVPFQSFATLDGRMVVACPKEKFWRSLCAVLGRNDLLGDPRLQDFAGRLRNRNEVVAAVAHELRGRVTREWLAALGEAGVPCAPVNDVADALTDPQAAARGAVVEIDHPRFGVVRQVGSPLRVDGATRTYRRAPARDEHREDILRRVCGYDDATIRARASAGAFG
jgi:crotonobetainyl-CoA:carnitine CoA-transferase CaiB-like acyl-CoA transferase